MIVLRLVGVEVVEDALSDAAHVFGVLLVGLLHHFGSDLVLLGLVHLGCDTPAEVAADGDSCLGLGVVGSLDETFLRFWRAVVPPELVEAFFDVELASVKVSNPVDGAAELVDHHLGEDHLTEGHLVAKALVHGEGDHGNEVVQAVHDKVEALVESEFFVVKLLLFLVD